MIQIQIYRYITSKMEVDPLRERRWRETFYYTFVFRQLDFSSEPGVANEILENEPKSCLVL